MVRVEVEGKWRESTLASLVMQLRRREDRSVDFIEHNINLNIEYLIINYQLSGILIIQAPSLGILSNTMFYIPICDIQPYNSFFLRQQSSIMPFMKFSTIDQGTKETVHPPQPAPVSLLPKAPFFIAKDVISSISGQEHQ